MVEVLLKKLLIIILLTTIFFLVGCQNQQDLREINGVTLVKKEKSATSKYAGSYLHFEKDNQIIRLSAKNHSQFEAIGKGTVVDVTYNKNNYEIVELNLVLLEEEVKEDE